jgi:lysophospholipase L1-like esterase
MLKFLRLLARSAAMIFVCQSALADKAQTAWVPAWYASPAPSPNANATLNNQTVRQVVHVVAGGKRVRLRLSNAFGTTPVHFDSVSIARRAAGSTAQADSVRKIAFSGHADLTVAPGTYALSDALDFDVPADSDLMVSIYISRSTVISTAHMTQRSAIYFSDGDKTAEAKIDPTYPDTGTWASWLWLTEVEVSGTSATGAVIAFGDSITDGLGLTGDSHADWPNVLADRLRAVKATVSVINAGITGNRLLRNGQWGPFGIAGLARFDSDVLAQPNAQAVLLFLGINDIGQAVPGSSDTVSAADIEDGLSQLAERGHERGLKVYAVTLAPFKNATAEHYYSDDKDLRRQAVNTWIRSSRFFDGVVDADKALDDPHDQGKMLPAYDSGDHLHPNAAGAAAIARAVPLEWFR